MKFKHYFSSLLAALLALPASALTAFTSRDANLRAGPSEQYPAVAVIRSGVGLVVEGCVSDYQWCDVSAGPHRGWMYAGNIVYPYQSASVPVIDYGAAIGIGIVAFSLANYWDRHYHARPWYSQRQHWIDRPIHYDHRPRPPGRYFDAGDHRPIWPHNEGPVPGFSSHNRPPHSNFDNGSHNRPPHSSPDSGSHNKPSHSKPDSGSHNKPSHSSPGKPQERDFP